MYQHFFILQGLKWGGGVSSELSLLCIGQIRTYIVFPFIPRGKRNLHFSFPSSRFLSRTKEGGGGGRKSNRYLTGDISGSACPLPLFLILHGMLLPSSVKIVLVFWSREKRKRKEISHILPAAEEEETKRWKGRQKKTCFGAEKKGKERKSFSLLAPSHDSPVEERVRHPDYF